MTLNQTKHDSASLKNSASRENKINSKSVSGIAISQEHFSRAYKEIETNNKKDSLWAMVYAKTESEEAGKKEYINRRAEELHQESLASAEQEAKQKRMLKEKQRKQHRYS